MSEDREMAVNIFSTKVQEVMSTMWYCHCYVWCCWQLYSLLMPINIFRNANESGQNKKSKIVSYVITCSRQLNNMKLTNKNMLLLQSPLLYKNYIWQTRQGRTSQFYLQSTQRLMIRAVYCSLSLHIYTKYNKTSLNYGQHIWTNMSTCWEIVHRLTSISRGKKSSCNR